MLPHSFYLSPSLKFLCRFSVAAQDLDKLDSPQLCRINKDFRQVIFTCQPNSPAPLPTPHSCPMKKYFHLRLTVGFKMTFAKRFYHILLKSFHKINSKPNRYIAYACYKLQQFLKYCGLSKAFLHV